MAAEEDFLERGFQLAYFIFPSRSVAVRILSGALNKLKAQRGRENRRAYWRDKYLKRGITRISRDEQDALQWLIFFESDSFEEEQERNGEQTAEEMAVRYIKNLVRMTTAMSSFHVNVGVHRLLHNYTTAEAQRVYETVTERYLGADEYRRAKGVLMAKLERRFGTFLRTFRTQHGELRFEACQDQILWIALADACLLAFTPWSTTEHCPVPRSYDSQRDTLPPALSGGPPESLSHDRIEINRCHAFIDPVCYARLANALAFDLPERRLALPRFFMENDKNENKPHHSPTQASPLTPEERKTVAGHLGAEAARRRKAGAQFVTIVVDGSECAGMALSGATEHTFEIEEGAELVEVRTADQGQDVLLATHRVAYTESQGIAPSNATIFLKGGRKLLLNISPSVGGEQRRALVQVSHAPPLMGASQSEKLSLWNLSKYAVAGCALLAAGWFLGASSAKSNRTVAQFKAPPALALTPSSTPQPSGTTMFELVSTYKLVPDDLITRGAGGSDIPSVIVPSRPVLLRLDLPVGAVEARKSLRATLRPFLKKTDLLSQSLRQVKSLSSGGSVSFWVPSTVLDPNEDYAVDLQHRSPNGRMEDVSSYIFRAVPGSN